MYCSIEFVQTSSPLTWWFLRQYNKQQLQHPTCTKVSKHDSNSLTWTCNLQDSPRNLPRDSLMPPLQTCFLKPDCSTPFQSPGHCMYTVYITYARVYLRCGPSLASSSRCSTSALVPDCKKMTQHDWETWRVKLKDQHLVNLPFHHIFVFSYRNTNPTSQRMPWMWDGRGMNFEKEPRPTPTLWSPSLGTLLHSRSLESQGPAVRQSPKRKRNVLSLTQS